MPISLSDFKLPTILTASFEDGPNGPILPALKEIFPDATFIARPGNINAWDSEDFLKAVKATGRKQLLIAGVLAEVCVAFPVLSALEAGYEVFIVTDASGTFNEGTRLTGWPSPVNCIGLAQRHRRLAKLLSSHLPGYGNLITSYNAQKAG